MTGVTVIGVRDDEVVPDAGDGDAGHATAAYICGLSGGSLAYTRLVDSGIETGKDERDRDSEQPSIAKFFLSRKVLLGVVIVLLAAGVLLATSRSTTSATVPDLVGEHVDPQLDGLRLRLEAAGLVLRNVSTAPCPTVDLPGASLEELPGTIIDQHPAAGKKVEASGAVDVTVCLPA